MLSEREDKQLLDLVAEFLVRDADNVQALRLLVRVYWWQRDVVNLRAALDRMRKLPKLPVWRTMSVTL